MICQLCKNEVPKFVKSHVIPKALHFDEKGSSDHLLILTNSDDKFPKRSRIGEYDEIVCHDYEKRFSRWDDCGIDLFRRVRNQDMKKIGNDGLLINVDYTLFKLFVLCTLWRAGASTQHTFSRITLSQEWLDTLGDILIAEDHVAEEDFPFVVTIFNEAIEKRFRFDPFIEDYDGVKYVRFYMYDGLTFTIKIDDKKSIPQFRSANLRKDGQLLIIIKRWSPSEGEVAKSIIAMNRKKVK